MAETNWGRCLEFVFAAEGGYVDDPLDPGGATNLGITRAELARWRHAAATKAELRALDTAEAAALYRALYWNATRCADLPCGVDLMVFDAAVNLGVGRSARFLQAAAGAVQDGSIGPATLAAIAGRPAAPLIATLASERGAYYRSLSGFDRFGAGWTSRLRQANALAARLSRPDSAAAKPAPGAASGTPRPARIRTRPVPAQSIKP